MSFPTLTSLQVYGVNKELYSSDGYYATPVDRLAYSYYVASYDEANIATQFAISATADCSVQVTLPGTSMFTSTVTMCSNFVF